MNPYTYFDEQEGKRTSRLNRLRSRALNCPLCQAACAAIQHGSNEGEVLVELAIQLSIAHESRVKMLVALRQTYQPTIISEDGGMLVPQTLEYVPPNSAIAFDPATETHQSK